MPASRATGPAEVAAATAATLRTGVNTMRNDEGLVGREQDKKCNYDFEKWARS